VAKSNVKKFQPGIHIPDMKYLTEDKAIENMPIPKTVYISMSQGIGAPAKPIVAEGDLVKKGQKIAEAGGFISANIFASVAGKVTAVKDMKNSFNVMENYICIENDLTEEMEYLPPLKSFESKDIVDRVKDAGIVGLGGAGFPTNVKLMPKLPIDVLVVNGAECEPYLTCDYRLMVEKTQEVAKGIKYIASALNITNIKLGIEENKPKAIELFRNTTDIEVVSLKRKYPQGSEKGLINVCTKRKVPTGKMPFDVGVVVQNIGTAYAIYQAVELNIPLIERVMTVAGEGINEPKNLLVRNGTKTVDIIEYCGGIKEDAVKIIRGGPMMGKAMYIVDGYTKKMDSGLLALNEEETNTKVQTNCINCGRCARACPMHLMPMVYDNLALTERYDMAKDYGVMNCIECGCCSYVCPANRSLVQSITLIKQKLRAKKEVK
jgi:electron transport complex protein RnfC